MRLFNSRGRCLPAVGLVVGILVGRMVGTCVGALVGATYWGDAMQEIVGWAGRDTHRKGKEKTGETIVPEAYRRRFRWHFCGRRGRVRGRRGGRSRGQRPAGRWRLRGLLRRRLRWSDRRLRRGFSCWGLAGRLGRCSRGAAAGRCGDWTAHGVVWISEPHSNESALSLPNFKHAPVVGTSVGGAVVGAAVGRAVGTVVGARVRPGVFQPYTKPPAVMAAPRLPSSEREMPG